MRHPSLRRLLTITPLALTLLVASSTRTYGQDAGEIFGRVTDKSSGTPLDQVTVQIVQVNGQDIEGRDDLRVQTDPDGTYRISKVPMGRLRVRFATIEHERFFADRDVEPSQSIEINAALTERGSANVIDIEDTLSSGASVNAFEMQSAATAGTRVDTEEIKKLGKGNAKDLVATLAGVSIVGRFPFVRGLGDRYGLTIFNGNTPPSPEPERKEIPLDLFPTNLISSLTLTKTHMASLPGEFAGGAIRIRTVDVPLASFFKLGVAFSGTGGTTYERFTTSQRGRYDTFTFEDGTRELPSQIPSTQVPNGLTNGEREDIGESFANTWGLQQINAPLDHKISLTFGDRWELGGQSSIGVVGGVNWSNSYQTIANQERRFLAAPVTGLITDQSQVLDTWTFEAELNALLNISYELNPGNRVGIRNFVTRSSEDRVRTIETVDFGNDRSLEERDIQFIERRLYNSQLYGQHLFQGDVVAEWRTSVSRVEREEPDHRNVKYFQDFGTDGFFLLDGQDGKSRAWLFLEEDSYDAALDISIPFHPFVDDPIYLSKTDIIPDQRIQLGGAFIERDREFESRTFTYRSGAGLDDDGNPIDSSLPAEQLFVPDYINPSGFAITESTENTDSYDADLGYYAGYLMFNFRLFRPLRLNAGVRAEKHEQNVFTTQRLVANPLTVEANLDDTDYLPSLNLTYELTKKMQFRLSGSETVNRPTLRELAPVRFQNSEGFRAQGNANLSRARLRNADLRWEWFPGVVGELLTLGLFYKEIKDPIERVTFAVSEISVDSWENADEAEVYGFEIEFRKKLDFLGSFFDRFTVKGNFARIESEVSIAFDPLNQQTNNDRPLQGQPEYTANVGLFYDDARNGWSAAVQLNSFGERISRVGKSGVPDEVEQSRLDLEASISKKFGDGTFRISAKNLTDDAYRFETGGIVTRRYKRGIGFGVSYSLSF